MEKALPANTKTWQSPSLPGSFGFRNFAHAVLIKQVHVMEWVKIKCWSFINVHMWTRGQFLTLSAHLPLDSFHMWGGRPSRASVLNASSWLKSTWRRAFGSVNIWCFSFLSCFEFVTVSETLCDVISTSLCECKGLATVYMKAQH